MLVNVKSNQLVRGLHFQVTYFIGLVNMEWYSQNEVGNIDILVLWRVCENPSARVYHHLGDSVNYVLLCKALTFQPTISLHASYRLTQIGFNCAKFVPISEEKNNSKKHLNYPLTVVTCFLLNWHDWRKKNFLSIWIMWQKKDTKFKVKAQLTLSFCCEK